MPEGFITNFTSDNLKYHHKQVFKFFGPMWPPLNCRSSSDTPLVTLRPLPCSNSRVPYPFSPPCHTLMYLFDRKGDCPVGLSMSRNSSDNQQVPLKPRRVQSWPHGKWALSAHPCTPRKPVALKRYSSSLTSSTEVPMPHRHYYTITPLSGPQSSWPQPLFSSWVF